MAVDVAVATKRCGMCGETKPLDEFSPAQTKGDKHGRGSRCRSCNTIRTRRYRAANPGKATAQNRRANLRSYGLTPEDFAALVAAQDGRCAICGQEPTRGRWGALAVDHCHDTGRVRALLCQPCNSGLGYFLHDPERLRAAASYLERHA